MGNKRIMKDSLGYVEVDADHLWGPVTQRSYDHFKIGGQKVPMEIIRALVYLKKACAAANCELKNLAEDKAQRIREACDRILNEGMEEQFPLCVYQTGSGTQTNMNVNEVIASLGKDLHPNDDVNRGQSTNDMFPSAIHIAGLLLIKEKLLPALDGLVLSMKALEEKYPDLIKSGRTHLMDAVPLRFCDEVSGWRSALEHCRMMIVQSTGMLEELAAGGTAVGTGLNAPEGFDEAVCRYINEYTGLSVKPDPNKFHALSMKDAVVYTHGALKALAADLLKIANDIRWLASGPRCGLGEITIPANEPGSSIMPGKVNPTQCEAMAMVCIRVMGNDASIGFAASQGNFELNVFMPLIGADLVQSLRILSDAMEAFDRYCVQGIIPDENAMKGYQERSLMMVTALSPLIGYEKAAAAAHKAQKENKTLKEVCLEMGLLKEEELVKALDPRKMVK